MKYGNQFRKYRLRPPPDRATINPRMARPSTTGNGDDEALAQFARSIYAAARNRIPNFDGDHNRAKSPSGQPQ